MHFEFPWVLEHTKDVTDAQWLMVTGMGFLLIVFLVVKFVWPSMIRPHLVQRQHAITQAAEQVESTLRETKALRDDYVQRLDRIEDETATRIAEAVREAEELHKRILAEARESAEALISRGHGEVERERAKAMARLRTEFVRGVIGAAEFAAAKSLNAAHQRRLVDEFVNELGAKS